MIATLVPNPIVVPAYADPVVWAVAFVAMFTEGAIVRALLRRAGCGVDPTRPLLVFNFASWLVFLVAVDAWFGPRESPWTLVGLEVAVVVVETGLVAVWAWESRWRDRASPTSALVPRLWQVFGAVLVGNLVSIAVSLLPPTLLFLAR